MRLNRAVTLGIAVALLVCAQAQAATPELSISSKNRLQDRREVASGQRSYAEGFADGRFYALIGADGSIPYRTSVLVGACYDTPLVARALRLDFDTHGAPLVMRMDRASVHDASQIDRLLEEYGVLLLHGPPHHPGFYGQLERQNRDHRVWFEALTSLPCAQVGPCLRQMLEAVNTLWRQRSLGWHTAAELWNARPRLLFDRNAFRQEVHERELRLARILTHRGSTADLAGRLAIEQTFTHWGYLRQTMGGWC